MNAAPRPRPSPLEAYDADVHGTPDALAIMAADPVLTMAYQLRFGGRLDAPPLDRTVAERFLVWFAVEGRHQMRGANFSPAYIRFLQAPAPPFATRLMAYLHLFRQDVRARLGVDLARFQAWYYTQGLFEHRLAPFLSAGEKRWLADLDPRGAGFGEPLRRIDYLAFQDARADGAPEADRAALRTFLAARRASPDPLGEILRVLPRADRADLPGVTIVGTADGVAGIGEDARALAEALCDAGVPVGLFNVEYPTEATTRAASGWEALHTDRLLFPITIICLPPFEMARLRLKHGPGLFENRVTIGYFPWELTSLPPEWRPMLDAVDEIWAISPFLAAVFERLTKTPVRFMPPLVPMRTGRFNRGEFGLSARDFLVLSLFDCNSFPARKNPLASIAAFRAAFPDLSGAERLVIKSLNGDRRPDIMRQLETAVAGDPRILLIDGPMPPEGVRGLIESADVFLSLHRAEGFGRVIAEAMLAQTPVVVTNWSGCVGLVDAGTGFPVPFALRPVRANEYPYAAGSVWAEPNVPAAAEALRSLRAGGEDVTRRIRAARERVEVRHGREKVAARLVEALERLAGRQPA